MEGYVGNIATGLLAGWNAVLYILGKPLIVMPSGTLLGALCNYITQAEAKNFQPMKANFGILPELEGKVKGKRERAFKFAERSKAEMHLFLSMHTELLNKG